MSAHAAMLSNDALHDPATVASRLWHPVGSEPVEKTSRSNCALVFGGLDLLQQLHDGALGGMQLPRPHVQLRLQLLAFLRSEVVTSQWS